MRLGWRRMSFVRDVLEGFLLWGSGCCKRISSHGFQRSLWPTQSCCGSVLVFARVSSTWFARKTTFTSECWPIHYRVLACGSHFSDVLVACWTSIYVLGLCSYVVRCLNSTAEYSHLRDRWVGTVETFTRGWSCLETNLIKSLGEIFFIISGEFIMSLNILWCLLQQLLLSVLLDWEVFEALLPPLSWGRSIWGAEGNTLHPIDHCVAFYLCHLNPLELRSLLVSKLIWGTNGLAFSRWVLMVP
jgi:hypothetical protein